MKTRTIALTLAFSLSGLAVAFAADDPNMGTWKLNEAKSKLSATMNKNHTVVYAADGDNVKVTVDGTDATGKATHSEWTGKFDGKPYAVTGDATSDMRTYKRIDTHTLTLASTLAGKATLSGTVVVSADGKTRTVTTTFTDASGKTSASTSVYDKQ